MTARRGTTTTPAHYQGDYYRRSAHIRACAYADPTTRCWRCQRTLPEIRCLHPRARWTAGHVIDALPGGPLAPECSPCNFSEGNARRRALNRRTELTWVEDF